MWVHKAHERMATIIRQEKSNGKVVWIDTGDIIESPGRQSQLKAETYSQLMGTLGVDTVAYTALDQKQGLSLLMSGSSLSKTKWLTPDAERSPQTSQELISEGLKVTAANDHSLEFGSEAESDILLFDGSQESLKRATKSHQLEIFSSDGIPSIDGHQVSPGSNLRGIVIAKFRDGKFVSARTVILEASIKDDPVADKIYENYLKRVSQERLIDKVVRETNEDFIGSKNCQNCHSKIYGDFLKSGHAKAYQTLIKEHHQADPDCVSCHVVGLNSTKGFIFEKTRSLAQVGCESCHGPGRAHARNPKIEKFERVASQKCLSCHTPSNSPQFNFDQYWKKIKH